MKIIFTTERLVLRQFELADAPFLLTLLNTEGWIKFIGDRGVKTVEQAEVYMQERILAAYQSIGYSSWLVTLKETNTPIGSCGLIKRQGLVANDIGFAFLPEYEGKGYAFESAKATLLYGKENLQLAEVVAITLENNERCIKLLENLGLSFVEKIVIPNDDEELMLYRIAF